MPKSEKPAKKIYQILMALVAIAMAGSILLAVIQLSKTANGESSEGNDKTVKVSDRTDLYQIPNNPTDYERSLYEDLARICNTATIDADEDLSTMAEAVARVFIADYFSWGNKRGSYDVGGLDYVFGPSHSNFAQSARRYYYYDLDLLMNKYGVENLPVVSNINIESVEKQDRDYEVTTEIYDYSTNTSYNEVTTYPYYLLRATWEYSMPEESTYDASNLPAEGYLGIVLREGRLEVAYYHKDYWR